MPKLRILIISNLFPPQVVGGYERAIADYARRLCERGHEILVLTADVKDLDTAYGGTTATEPMPVQRCLQLFGTWVGGIKYFAPEQAAEVGVHNYQVLEQQIAEFAPDVCLCGNLDFLGAGIPKQLLAAQIPVAHFVMNNGPGYPRHLSPDTDIYQYITVSDWIKGKLVDGGYPTDGANHPAVTIYPGADTDFFAQTTLPPRDRLRIIYAGLVVHYKGADVFVDALNVLHQEGIDFTATIAGGSFDANYVAQLEDFVKTQGMADRVQFTGLLSKEGLRDLYQNHNVYVLPSRFNEPFSIGLIEAMAAGLTCIASHVGGSPEAITDQETGLIFTSENVLELADSLAGLPLQPELWESMALAGQQKALTQFSRQRTIEQIEAVLWSLYQRRFGGV